ncbi:coatomer subunit gamma [Serendipita sp. 401]|nr:coatomer subunit gamma [Serendipita sp. 401]
MATKKDDEEIYYNNKITIIQEARIFNESPVNPRKCRTLLTRIVYLLYTGETFATHEATSLFFGTTKLFQHKDPALRQAVYLAIKELSSSAEDVIMVTSSIMKDMQGNMDLIYRPNAIRALCRIIDPSMLQGVERFFKAAIVDKNTAISSAALVSSYHFFPVSKEVIKRWANEVQESVQVKPAQSPFIGSVGGPLNLSSAGGYLGFGSSAPAPPSNPTIPSTSNITQYHALGLLYAIRQQDRMAVTKMIQQLAGGRSGAGSALKNPMALCMLIRYASKVMDEDPNVQKQMFDLLEGWLRHKSDMVNYEAARAICEMRNVTPQQLTRAAIFDMIRFIKESKEAALAHLCEFIEDCEFTKLSVRVLHLLGIEGPKAPNPTKYIRYIYNRVVLENAIVRAAAVTSLAKFGVCGVDPTIKRSVTVLLNRCLDDVDDEVRDRAALYLRIMKEEELAESFVKEDSVYSLATLESKLVAYVNDPAAQEVDFDASSVPKISRAQAQQESARPTTLESITASVVSQPKASAPAKAAPSAQETQSAYASQLAAVPEMETFGTILNSSSKPIPLTESDTEYVVTCVKHIFKEHVVFQFNVSNTVPDSLLENVSVVMQPNGEGLTEDFILPAEKLDLSTGPQPVYVSFTRENPEEYTLGGFACTLRFVSKEVDPSSGLPEDTGYDDEYQLEEVELSAGGDYIVPTYCSFESEWEKLDGAANAEEEFSLSSMASIKAACESLIEVLNMEALAGSDNPTSTAVHTLLLSGLVAGGGGKVLARCQMAFTASSGVSLRMSVRAEKEEVSQLLISAIG